MPPPARASTPPPGGPGHVSGSHTRGLLMAIGGAEDKLGSRLVLSELVARAGGRGAVIAVFPTASQMPGELGDTYTAIFRDLGATAHVVQIDSRADGEAPAHLELLSHVSAIFFTGGAQGRIVTLLGGTPLATAIRRAHRRGVLVAGTSAGASVVCEHMIAQGKRGYAPRRESVTLAPGFGLTKRLIIDQHFAQRHRIGRLFSAVALNPYLIGVGIDEDTAITLDAQDHLRVLGRGTVTVIDGAKILYTDIHETPGARPAALLGLQVHVLTPGCGFDVHPRRPVWPPTPVPVAAAVGAAAPGTRAKTARASTLPTERGATK
ncbi:MAG: cyanophycinase [Myxococcales bacterium]|nr:cyanophycinase [Myxococcales bacterium]